jgi:hypothetical protein
MHRRQFANQFSAKISIAAENKSNRLRDTTPPLLPVHIIAIGNTHPPFAQNP